uniref:Uncharacterized protein n=1 Tax=Panagrolaimus superbus TaxID=310955 RepID=A0A914YGS4_9BILA
MNKLNGISSIGNTSASSDNPYRTALSESYNFGYDDKAESKTRLIVKEQGSKQVREYDLEDGINYFCRGCFIKNRSKNYAYFDEDGFLMIPERHNCELISFEASNQDQRRKRALFIEAQKQRNPNLITSQNSTTTDPSKAVPFVDLTDFSENPEANALVEDVQLSKERSNASSPEYIPESGPFYSISSSLKALETSSINKNMAAVHFVKTAAKDASENNEEQSSSQSFNVTETSSEPSSSSPPGSNGKENRGHNEILLKTVTSNDHPNIRQKTNRSEFEENSATHKSAENIITLDDDANVSVVAKSNEDFKAIESEDYQYGYSQNGIPNCRLIVFDSKEYREFVRQYSKISNRKQWYCMGCYRAKRKHNKAYFSGETFMAPRKHFCQKFSYKDAKEMQREIIQRLELNDEPVNKPLEMVKTRSRTVGGDNFSPTSSSISRSDKAAFDMVILSPVKRNVVGDRVIKTDSEFDDGYHDYSTNSSSPLEDTVDAGVDEEYLPSQEVERIPTKDYKFGYSAKKGNRNGRLIVFETNDKTKVRQYAWNNCNFYFCIECYRLKKKKFGGKMLESTFLAPKDHFCKPISFEEAMQQQAEIVEKFGLGRPANGGNVGEASVRISRRLQDKRESHDAGDDLSDVEFEDESVEPIPYHSTPTDRGRRLVQDGDFIYGVGNSNQENFKIIVFEENDRNLVRCYGRKTQRQWYCCGCLRLRHSNYGTVSQSIFHAPIEHTCKPLKYDDVMHLQQRIRDRYRKLSPSMNTHSTSPGMSLSHVAPIKPGSSSLSPPKKKKFIPKTEMEKRYDEEKLRNLVIKNPPIRNMAIESSSTNLDYSKTPQRSFSSSVEYREVDSFGYEYGFNELGEKRKRLIVYERNRAFIREYSHNNGDKWMCVHCTNGFARKVEDNFIVTIRHNCIPILATKSKELQAQFKALSDTSTPLDRLSVSSVNNNSSVGYIGHGQNNTFSSNLPSSYREVHPNNWHYGYDSYGNPNKRIIVRNDDNLDFGHEYRNDRNDTRCLGCAKNGKVAAKLIDGNLYVPPSSEHTCGPRIYSEIQRLQGEYKRNMGRKRGRTVFSMEAATTKRARNVVHRDDEASNSPEECDFEDSYMDNSNLEHQVLTNVEQYSPSDHVTSVSFYAPSAFFLSKCCKELNVKYSSEAYKFWSRILIEKVKFTSRPLTTCPTKEGMYHGFSSFSIYFTGNESSTAIIREMMNRYVYNNFKSLGYCMGHDFSQYSHETPIIREALWSFSLTEIHLECISRWFDCRIGIYEEKKWKRYGNWDDEESAAATFLMEIKDGKYNPVLALA